MMVTGLEEAKFNMSLETFSKYYFTTLEKCLRLTVGGTAHGAAEDETKLWFGFSRNEGFRLWAWLMYRTSSHGCGSFFFFFWLLLLSHSVHPPSAPFFIIRPFLLLVSLPLSVSFFSSFLFILPSISLCTLGPISSLSCDPSAYSKSRTNKQAAGGSSLLSIIQASQTTASMFAKHMKCISLYCREREREKKYVLPSWLGHITQRLSRHSTERLKCCLWRFCFVLIENTQGKGRDDGIGRTLWAQKFVKSKPLCFEGEIHLNAKFLTGFLVKNKICPTVNCTKMSALSKPSRGQPDESRVECMRVCFLWEDLRFS